MHKQIKIKQLQIVISAKKKDRWLENRGGIFLDKVEENVSEKVTFKLRPRG